MQWISNTSSLQPSPIDYQPIELLNFYLSLKSMTRTLKPLHVPRGDALLGPNQSSHVTLAKNLRRHTLWMWLLKSKAKRARTRDLLPLRLYLITPCVINASFSLNRCFHQWLHTHSYLWQIHEAFMTSCIWYIVKSESRNSDISVKCDYTRLLPGLPTLYNFTKSSLQLTFHQVDNQALPLLANYHLTPQTTKLNTLQVNSNHNSSQSSSHF